MVSYNIIEWSGPNEWIGKTIDEMKLTENFKNYENNPLNLISKETDTYLIDDMFYPENYGTLSIDEDGEVSVKLKDLNGKTVSSTILKMRG